MEIKVKNVMEEIVGRRMDPIIKEFKCCTCDKCKADIAAYVLNNIRPKYVSTEKGELFSRSVQFDKNFDMNLTILISTAVKQVKENPRH